MQPALPRSLVVVLVASACGDSGRASGDGGASESVSVTQAMPTSAPTGGPGETGSSGGSVSATGSSGAAPTTGSGPTGDPGGDPSGDPGTTGSKLDVGATGGGTVDPGTTSGEPVDLCKVQDDMNAIGECDKEAPPNSFEPEIQWAWTGPNGDQFSIVTPLVANLTDDNADGMIDLCDTPDVVVVASPSSGQPNIVGHIYVLDGLTGALHFQIPDPVDHTVTPAIGDIDGDGLPEIVTSVIGGNPVVFEHDGAKKWTSASSWPEVYSGAIALADADNDGDVEILAGNRLFDHLGTLLFTAPQPSGNWSSSAFADLDGDKDQEVVLGHAAYHHDGQQYYVSAVGPGYPSIANLDLDPEPEVLVTNQSGLSLLNHDGTVIYQDQRPTGDPPGATTWLRPSTVHDFDGDGKSEYATSSANNYTTYKPAGPPPQILWKAAVSDQSGIAAGTAFDFLGDGVAEAMYADEHFMFIFDGAGKALLQIPRSSGTLSEYPIVADIDNDGSAEIVVVSCFYQEPTSPTVQVIRDKMDRWIQARRIWNQHTYHVTNVREDSTIPQFEAPSWKQLNTFRTNSQIEGGGLCKPPIPQ
ncbi:MAG: VCBS repeat-containing protein [Myxococcales bacterium]|nr:VCBS repeat-containing protein [Myxococcales bacterium]